MRTVYGACPLSSLAWSRQRLDAHCVCVQYMTHALCDIMYCALICIAVQRCTDWKCTTEQALYDPTEIFLMKVMVMQGT